MEALYELLPKQPKFTTVSIPLEAVHRDAQSVTPANPGLYLSMNPTPPSLPVPAFPNEDTPTPPSSPSPQMTLDVPARPLWPNPPPPIPPTTETDDLQIIQTRTQHPENPDNIILGNAAPATAPPRPLLRTIVTTRKSIAGMTSAARNILWDPVDKYNKAPMPKVHDANPTAIFDSIDLSVIDEWDSLPEGKLAAIPFGPEVDKISLHDEIRRRIFTAAAEITKAQQTAVAGPRPHAHAKQDATPPYTFLIYNLSEIQRRTLLDRSVWSSAEITFRVTPLLPTKPDFLFSIAGLSTLATDNVREMVLRTWQKREPLLAVKAIIQATNNDAHATSLDDLESFLNSMVVERLDMKEKKGILAPRYNVYANANFIQDPDTWEALRHTLATQQYHSTMLGCGTVRLTPFNCRVCHGVDHPSGLCPFLDIEGWKGPTGQETSEMMGNGNSGNRTTPKQSKRWN